MPRRPVLAALTAGTLALALAACSDSGGSVASLGASSSPSTSASATASATATAGPTSVATASASDTKALLVRAVTARKKVRYVETQTNYTYRDDRIFAEVDTIDYGVTPHRLRASVTFGKQVIETIVQQDGDVYALGLISNMPKTWVRLRPGGKDGISKAFKQFGDQMRAVAKRDDLKDVNALALERGLVPAGSSQILDEPVQVYKGELDVAKTLAGKKLDPRLRRALRLLKGEKAYLQIEIDSAGLIRSLVQDFGPTTFEVKVRPVKAGHAFDLPPASKIASPDRIRITVNKAPGKTTKS
ncbi:hypothetical protein [Angustibacter luteus]|uniref:DUF4292 domain-containing protein n=1 Tax=Angustibacter luteus TaxID=658456 RepID=A0ABW1JET0_9ACTN